jgi:hypothetical protein
VDLDSRHLRVGSTRTEARKQAGRHQQRAPRSVDVNQWAPPHGVFRDLQ